MRKTHFTLAPLALAAFVAFGIAGVAQAQGAAVVNVSIAPQPLGQALNELARQTNLQLSFPVALVAGKTAPAVSGRLTAVQALERLLVGSGLAAAIHGNEAAVRPVADPHSHGGDTTLPLVTVTAQGERSEATEGTGSYTTSRVSLGKGQSIRETPQSITVITRQRIEDQGLSSVGEVMQQTTGVTVDYTGVAGLGGVANSFLSRGFQMGSVQIDGAAVDAFSQNVFDPNLAMFDSVQVVRGVDGLFSGNGEAGGSINLVRKRPLAQSQVLATAAFGSWNQRRVELDVAGPLEASGRVRGRAVLSHVDREFFYDHADAKNTLLYGIVEADITPDTLLTLGGSYEKVGGTPWRWGLPRAASGADLHLPRNTSLTAAWSDYNKTSQEVFAQLDQRLAGDWRMKVQANYIKVESDTRTIAGSGAIDPATGLGSQFNRNANDFGSVKKSVDVNVTGAFELLGRQHKLLVGADWQDVKDRQDTYLAEYDKPLAPINIYTFDPRSVPYPDRFYMNRSFPHYGATQKSVYGRLNISLSDRLTAIVGSRYASYDYVNPTVNYARDGRVTARSMLAYKESGILTPYGGLVYDLNDRWTAYGSIAEIYKSQASRLQGPLPGTPLDAIKGRNYEIGVKGEFDEGRLNTSMALYRIERTGEGVRDPNYPSTGIGDVGLNCCWIQQGEVVSQGLDAEISGELARGWQVFSGYTYNDNRNKSDASRAAYNSVTPRHLFKLWTTYRLQGDLSAWTLGGGVNLQSTSYVSGTALAYNPASDKFDGPAVPFRFNQAGYAVWNATVQYRFHRNWTAVLNLNNLFDKTYYKTVGTSGSQNWYGDPRNVMLTLRGTF